MSDFSKIEIAILTVVGLIMAYLLYGFFSSAIDAILWGRTKAIKWPGKLIQVTHHGSTLQTSSVPVMTSDGKLGIGITTTGHDEEFYTLWDLGKYGRVSVDDKVIFQYAKEQSELWIKVRGYRVRIVAIED